MTNTDNIQAFIDPVCRMKVSRDSTVLPFMFQSVTYHFCTDVCRKVFIADPERYLKSKPTKRNGWWARYLERLNKATGGRPPCCH